MKRVVAVTGANGFIGGQIVRYLNESAQYEVIPVSRSTVNLLSEKEVFGFFQGKSLDAIIHCANAGGNRKAVGTKSVLENNLRMFFNLEQCLKPGMKFINFGSGAQYNKDRNLVNVQEEEIELAVPQDEYGYSKYVMSKYIKQHGAADNGAAIYNLILFGVYGRGEDYTYRFISNAIVKNLLHMPIVINQNVLFDYLYIDDLLRVLERLLENDWKEREFNVTPGDSISLVQATEIINSVSDYQSEIIVKNEGMNYQYTGSNRKLMQCMGENFVFTSYEEGIRQLYCWYKDNFDMLDLDSVRKDEYIRFCKNT